MRRYIGYREFVQRDQRSLVGTALLLTGSHDQAIRLALRSFHSVSLTWPPPLWENPTTHAQIALYRRFLQKPTAAGTTALIRLPPRQRVLVVACLHHGRTRGEMATLLSLPVATVETEITEAVAALTKGNEDRLITRLTTAADEASVPDLTAQAMRALRRRRTRGALLTAVAALIPIGLIAAFALLQQGAVWNSALGERNRPRSTSAPEAMRVISTPTPSAALQPWQVPRTSSVIRYAVPGQCPGEIPPMGEGSASSRAWEVTCAGWTLNLVSGKGSGGSAPGSGACEGKDHCESTVSVPDAAQHLVHGDERDGPRLNPAISLDGRRVAYLSAAERRYVAHDLRSGMKRYLSPVLAPADTENGTMVSVSANGRHFTVTLGKRQLRTDFMTGVLTPLPAGRESAAEKAADWLRQKYRVWKDSPSGRYSAAVGTKKATRGSLHIIDAESRKIFKRLPLPPLGQPARGEVVSWLNAHEVIVKMRKRTGGESLGFFRVDAVTGRVHRVADLPGDDPIVLGAATAL